MRADWRPSEPQICIDGRKSVVIDGCHRICEYERESIKINVGKYNIRVIGSGLHIINLSDGCVRIDGQILSLDLRC